MGLIGKVLVAACVAFGFHYAVKQIVATAVTTELGDQPPNQTPPITVDPQALQRSQEVGRAIDTSAASRQMLEDLQHQFDQRNPGSAPFAVPVPHPHHR